MKKPIIDDLIHLKELCQPVADYLKENGNPHIAIHIADDRIRVIAKENKTLATD